MNDGTALAAKEKLANSVSFWRSQSILGSTQDVIDAATECLVAGLDSPALRVLAGTSANEPHYILEPLIIETLEELDMPEVLEGSAERSAFIVIANQVKSGQITPRELTAWAHTYIGHDGNEALEPFVELDDMYSVAEEGYLYTLEDLDRWTMGELDAFLAGQPSPRHTDRWLPPADQLDSAD